MNHYAVMFIIMIASGFLSTMNIFVDKIDDIRFSLNDLYMVLLMTGWMFLFMGLFYKNFKILFIGFLLVVLNLLCIRKQFLITENQYKMGMIPHHSMAIHMSKKLLEKNNYKNSSMNEFLLNLIHTQENEIVYLKQ